MKQLIIGFCLGLITVFGGCVTVELNNSARLMARPDFQAAAAAAPGWVEDSLLTINKLESIIERGITKLLEDDKDKNSAVTEFRPRGSPEPAEATPTVKPNEFKFTEEFTDSLYEKFFAFYNHVKANDYTEVTIHITSFGGYVYVLNDMLALLHDLKRDGVIIHTHIPRYAMSAGAVLFIYGDIRTMGNKAVVGFHTVQNNGPIIQHHFNDMVRGRLMTITGDWDLCNRVMQGEMTYLNNMESFFVNISNGTRKL